MAEIPNLRLVRQTPNRGKGAAVRRGMLEARGQIRVMCDADGSMPPEQLPRLLAPIIACKAEISIGSRYAPGAHTDVKQPWYRVVWSRLANRVIQRSLVPGIRDTQCGFKAFTAQAARDLFSVARIDGWAFDLEILALAKRSGIAIAEIGVECDRRWPLARQSPARHVEGRAPGTGDPQESAPQRHLQQELAERGVCFYACNGSFVGEGDAITSGGVATYDVRGESPATSRGQGAG